MRPSATLSGRATSQRSAPCSGRAAASWRPRLGTPHPNRRRAMRNLFTAMLAGAVLIGAAYAHPATEQYIPIGQSPGDGTVQGRAGAVAEPSAAGAAPTVTVETATAPQSFVVGSRTRVYIDRSAQGLPNTVGTLADV